MPYARKYTEDGSLDYPGLELSVQFHREKGQPYSLVVIVHCAQNHPEKKDLKVSYGAVIEFHYEEEFWGSIRSSESEQSWLQTSDVYIRDGNRSYATPVLVVEDSPLVEEYLAKTAYPPEFGAKHYLFITGADILNVLSDSQPALEWIDTHQT